MDSFDARYYSVPWRDFSLTYGSGISYMVLLSRQLMSKINRNRQAEQ